MIVDFITQVFYKINKNHVYKVLIIGNSIKLKIYDLRFSLNKNKYF